MVSFLWAVIFLEYNENGHGHRKTKNAIDYLA